MFSLFICITQDGWMSIVKELKSPVSVCRLHMNVCMHGCANVGACVHAHVHVCVCEVT